MSLRGIVKFQFSFTLSMVSQRSNCGPAPARVRQLATCRPYSSPAGHTSPTSAVGFRPPPFQPVSPGKSSPDTAESTASCPHLDRLFGKGLKGGSSRLQRHGLRSRYDSLTPLLAVRCISRLGVHDNSLMRSSRFYRNCVRFNSVTSASLFLNSGGLQQIFHERHLNL